MGNFRKAIVGIVVLVAMFVSASEAQTTFNGYGDFGGGFSQGLGFNVGEFVTDGGIDIYHNKYFGEAELGWDSADLQFFQAGTTFRAHGLLMYQAKPHWRFGGGLHFSKVIGQPNDQLSKYWPVAAVTYERRRFRINNEYLFSVGSYFMTGPLFDMRYRIGKGFYYRERFGMFFYRDRGLFDSPVFHGGEADFGVLYVIRDHREVQ
jgi:hypothetical protein